MITRYLASATIGIAVTAGLLFLMHLLIEISEAVETNPGQRARLTFVERAKDTPTMVGEMRPVRPDPPVQTPPLIAPLERSTGNPPIGIATHAGPTPGPLDTKPVLGFSNNPLINIISVQPGYPAVALRQGLEGIVIVQFDVTAMGTVENVSVIESSSRIFDKAAVDAAHRFRYRARMVDGMAMPTEGIRQLFRFEMKQE